jgi:glycosyltransferase involved in cell wall biosynthesis
MSARFVEARETLGQSQVRTAPPLPVAQERPRVLHLVTSFEAGGTERQFIELLKRLDRQRFDVHLAALRAEGPFYEEIAAHFPSVPEFRLTSFYNRNAWHQLRRLQSLLKSERIDLIHTHGFYDSLFGAVAGRLCGIRVIASQRHLQLSERRAHHWGTRAIHQLAHKIIVNSEAIRDSIRQQGKAADNKIKVIYNGLCATDEPETGRQSIQSHPEPLQGESKPAARTALCAELGLGAPLKLVGIVARLVAVKGHRYFLEAASRVAREDERVHFVLVGEGPLRSELEDQCRQLGIGERVHFLGDRKDARRLVSAFDVSLQASLSEGLPNSVMEAMSAGVPVIATAVGGTKELIRDGETGFFIPPANASALAERLLFVLRNEAACRQIAERGRQVITRQFGMQRMVESVEKLYEEILTNP